MRRLGIWALVSGVAGCAPEPGYVMESASGSTTVFDDGETAYDPMAPACGNGFVETDEECDDGNAIDDDGCSSACEVRCGLQWETTQVPPTADSILEPVSVVAGQAGIVVAAQLQENVAEQDGTITYGDFEVWVRFLDLAGEPRWTFRRPAAFDDIRTAAAVMDEAGDVFVAATVDAESGGTDIWLARLGATDGMPVWPPVRFDSGNDSSEDSAFDLALTPDGDVVVSGLVRVAQGDDDAWVGKFAAADGSTVWTQTFSGEGSAGFSNDEAGPVDVTADGTVHMLAQEYVDGQNKPPVLLSFPAEGGAPAVTPVTELPEGPQLYSLFDVVAVSSGGLLLSYAHTGIQTPTYILDQLSPDLMRLSRRTADDFRTEGSDWRILGVDTRPGGGQVVVGDLLNDYEAPPTEWNQLWASRLDSSGALECFTQQTSTQEGLVPPNLFGPRVAVDPNDGAIVAGREAALDDTATLWIGRFRGL